MNKKCKKVDSGSNSITCGESGDGGGGGGGTDPPVCACTSKVDFSINLLMIET